MRNNFLKDTKLNQVFDLIWFYRTISSKKAYKKEQTNATIINTGVLALQEVMPLAAEVGDTS